MKIAVFGLWHLGCVYAASLATLGNNVIAIDEDIDRITTLRAGKLPIAEPGLPEMMKSVVDRHQIKFTSDLHEASECELVWITIDTPVNERDIADVNSVLRSIENLARHVSDGSSVVISSQLPIGTSALVSEIFSRVNPAATINLAYSPENLRLGSALKSFMEPDRVVVGSDSPKAIEDVTIALATLGKPILGMSTASAEVTKHALNTFLALSVAFANEIARVSESTGANAFDVAKALKTDQRIGAQAYVAPGGPIAGGTLARDVRYLEEISKANSVSVPLINSIMQSHDEQHQWPIKKIQGQLGSTNSKILIVGVAYKAGTSTLRRSFGLEVATKLEALGYGIAIYDGLAEALTPETQHMERYKSLLEALQNVDAAVICGPEVSAKEIPTLLSTIKSKIVIIDAIGLLGNDVAIVFSDKYFTPGKGTSK
ncbi:MAG: nucleotide sugar dehydrogenase [Actinomycetota bacterium]|nr:nucleotide sugar dehydrogenase [Actinomycetota bacterium]